MMVARKLDDLPGLEWSTAGILGQAWLPEQAKMWDDAYRVAQAKLKTLRDNKRNEEADRFQAAIDQALVRDCIVRVQWTGDADIDVMVKEPGGTICSLRNQRTTGGGTLIGDLSSPDGKESIEGHTAVYSCPQAINGEYQVLVRRVFGNVPTGHVKVIVDQHMFTPQAKQTVWDKIPVKDGESVVKFTLADGRRKESAHEAQIVNAAVAAVGIRQQQAILAQQLAVLNDPQRHRRWRLRSRIWPRPRPPRHRRNSRPTRWRSGPTTFRGAVGYQPVIVILPTGTNMGLRASFRPTAVMSASPVCRCFRPFPRLAPLTSPPERRVVKPGKRGVRVFPAPAAASAALAGITGAATPAALAVVLVAVALAAVAASSKPNSPHLAVWPN